jgi:predicted NUDIX family NTP pyrophosphohydrolase
MFKTSAGLLMYRIKEGKAEVFLVHPGGPFWKNKDDEVWSIPKGEMDEGETDLLTVAQREFEEETGVKPIAPFTSLGTVERPGKTVHIWFFQGDCDPTALKSNMITIDWPPRSGKKIEIPEVDRGGFFSLDEAKVKLVKYQVPIIEKFMTQQIISDKLF